MDPSYFTDTNSLLGNGSRRIYNAIRSRKNDGESNEYKFERANDNNDDDRLPHPVLFALFIVGMWTPSSRPCTGQSSSDKDELRRPLLDKDNNNINGVLSDVTSQFKEEDLDGLKKIDFISLHLEPSRPKKHPKRLWYTVIVEIATLFYLSVLTSTLLIDGGTYLYAFWGKSSELLYMISYVTFILQVLLCPIYSLLNRLSVLIPGLDKIHRCPLMVDFVKRRVRVLCESGHRTPLSPHFMVLFISWPVAHAILRAITWLIIDHKCHVQYFIFSDSTASWGFVVYGLFWYLIYVERVSLHQQLNRTVRDVKRASLTQDIDAARHEICHVHRDYFVVRELMGVWMAITMVTASWGIMSRLSWDYAISAEGDIIMDRSQLVARYYLDITIWSEKIMFVVFPCIALGGINLEYLWQRFRHVLETLGTAQHRAFWLAMHLHTLYIDNIGSPELKWTLVFVLIGPYLSLQSKIQTDQNLAFWNGPFPGNCTNNSADFFPVR